MKLRVSIVDDDEPTRQILKDLIQQSDQLEFVSEHPDTESALEHIPQNKPDVVLMDINVPLLNGIECVRLLKPQLPGTQFLMLTVYADADHIFAALSAGATGYLLKGTRRTQLLTAIKQISQGGSPMSCAIARKVVQSFTKTSAVSERTDIEVLSPRERTVLDLLAKGYLYKEIAESLSLSVMTVDTYVRRVYEKLHVNSRSQAIAKYLQR
ncbi:DNA-binding response regulator [Nibricoccus aquaticus]|uniref:DNA-binding response regulator n=1 Tax=Nibricoccus aquaticus TaxID=2576891 RepID=A0A290Q608_9BACT|nr:response regulator transcription factor [Nibricoccus aquaticus]ATC63707.1 DNA-binding response regulator [Nibricoccus aquaticus]